MKSPCAIVPPKGVCAAFSGSVWIHWWSPVTSANWLIVSCVTSYQSLTPSSWPTAALTSSGPVRVVVMGGSYDVRLSTGSGAFFRAKNHQLRTRLKT